MAEMSTLIKSLTSQLRKEPTPSAIRKTFIDSSMSLHEKIRANSNDEIKFYKNFILFNSEQHDMQMRYHVEQKKQQERAEELQRLRDEIQAELEKRFEERVIELEMFF